MGLLGNEIIISGFSDEISSSLDRQIEAVKSLGMEYICLRDIDGINIGKYTMKDFSEKVTPRLSERGIKVSSIGSPIGKIFIDDEEGFKGQLQVLEELCQIAVSIGCKYIRVFSFYIREGEHGKYAGRVIDRLKQIVSIAERYGIILIHENEKDIYGDTAARCREIMDEVKSSCFRSAFDFANFVQCGEDTLEAYEMLKDFIAYIHIKDASYNHGRNVLCGTGDGHIEEILKEHIVNMGYKGFLTLEPHLVQFEGLKNLELGNTDEIIMNEENLTGEEGYRVQYRALLEILKKLGEDK